MAKHTKAQGAEHDFRAMPLGWSNLLCHHPVLHQYNLGKFWQAIIPI
jgi:hypothetical protein